MPSYPEAITTTTMIAMATMKSTPLMIYVAGIPPESAKQVGDPELFPV
ncbi:MAG: hypothetical protein IPN98_10480 [Propionivibrio sp.]|nr:hypothetical protein [Propionivibrio sp.]